MSATVDVPKPLPCFPISDPGGGRRRPRARRKGPRSRQEVEEERRQLREETLREIDQIVAEFHARLPREKASSIGAIYARYSTRFQDRIADQVRTLLEVAIKLNVFVPRENIFFDLAVRGCKEQRPGLDQLKKLLARRGVGVLLIFSTNRLFRKTYKALRFVEEEVVERGIRCVIVKSGVDTADEKRWRMLLQIHAMTDEFVVGMYGDNIRAAHEGLFDLGLVCNTLTFGYRGEPIAGEFTTGRTPRAAALRPVRATAYRQRRTLAAVRFHARFWRLFDSH